MGAPEPGALGTACRFEHFELAPLSFREAIPTRLTEEVNTGGTLKDTAITQLGMERILCGF